MPANTRPQAPADLTDDALEVSITTLAATIAAATCELLGLVAEFDRREAWGGAGLRSCAHWLNWKCGIALGAAREKVRVARALETLPAIRAAFAAGTVSYSKVRAMTRIATAANEDYLLMIARHGTAAHVERAVRACRRVDRLEASARANENEAARACRWHYDDDGMLVLSARLPAEAGAALVQALGAALDELGNAPAAEAEGVSAETSPAAAARDLAADEPFAARRADALCRLAEQFLANGPAASATASAERHQIVVHVDPPALRARGEYARCDLEDGPALAPETARRLACDAAVVTMTDDPNSAPLDVGRRTRTVPGALRRFLRHRDGGCRFPGCTQHRHVDAHHVRHWADGGATRADNLVLLCRHHHRLVHEGGFGLERRTGGQLVFTDRRGRRLDPAPTPPVVTAGLPAHVAARGIDVSAETLVPDWTGERMDDGMVVDGLLGLDGRLKCDATDQETHPT